MTSTDIDSFGMHVLCIDDSKSQLALYQSQLENQYDVQTALTYEESIAHLTTKKPDVIILDMTMPQVTGLEFLDILRFTPTYSHIPVIIVSGDYDGEHIKEALRKGAADYIKKPYDEEELILRIQRIFRYRDYIRREAQEEAQGRVQSSAKDLMIESLGELAAARDNETGDHLARIEGYVLALANRAAELDAFKGTLTQDFIEDLGGMSRLHDIGKVSVPDHILHKPGPLTEREFEVMKRHTVDGAETIKNIKKAFPHCDFLDIARDIVLFHHERWDGTGYPQGLKENAIPLSARIVAFADVFDAITSKRVYKDAIGFDEAMDLIAEGRGSHFDPFLCDVFLSCREELQAIRSRHQ